MATSSLHEILGQRTPLGALRAAISSGRIHHAWIFQGPAGVGKRTTAEAFAATLLDPTTGPNLSGEIEPEEGSETQRLIAQGLHPDLHIITKELARFSDDRAIRERKLITIPKEVIEHHLLNPAARAASMKPGAMAGKVFIVDEAELLNIQTQNALLKTLEEPAPGTVIILITSSPDLLLPTIQSRCQRISFEPLGKDAMAEWLQRWQKDREEKVDAKTAKWAIDYSGGAPGVAALAIEGCLFEWAATLEPMLAAAESGKYVPELGTTMAKLVDEWAKDFVDKKMKQSKENASKDAANRAGAGHLFTLVSERARRRLCADHAKQVDRALRTIEVVGEAERLLDTNVQLALVMENLAVQIGR